MIRGQGCWRVAGTLSNSPPACCGVAGPRRTTPPWLFIDPGPYGTVLVALSASTGWLSLVAGLLDRRPLNHWERPRRSLPASVSPAQLDNKTGDHAAKIAGWLKRAETLHGQARSKQESAQVLRAGRPRRLADDGDNAATRYGAVHKLINDIFFCRSPRWRSARRGGTREACDTARFSSRRTGWSRMRRFGDCARSGWQGKTLAAAAAAAGMSERAARKWQTRPLRRRRRRRGGGARERTRSRTCSSRRSCRSWWPTPTAGCRC